MIAAVPPGLVHFRVSAVPRAAPAPLMRGDALTAMEQLDRSSRDAHVDLGSLSAPSRRSRRSTESASRSPPGLACSVLRPPGRYCSRNSRTARFVKRARNEASPHFSQCHLWVGLDQLQEQFNAAGALIFGSGWVFVTVSPDRASTLAPSLRLCLA